MKGALIITKRELKEILVAAKEISDTTQFTLTLEKIKPLVYWHIIEDE